MRGPRRLILACVALAVAIGGAVLWTAGPSEDALVAITRTPTSYRITYRVDDFAGNEHRIQTERLVVRRPFEARREILDGPPPGRVRVSVQVDRLGRTSTSTEGDEPVVLVAEPAPPGADLRPAIALETALDQGLLERRGTERVAGRRCQIYRAGGPIQGGALVGAAEAEEHADVCIDGAGLLLSEEWVVDGDVLRRRTAVEVEEGIDVSERMFAVDGEPPSLEQGGGAMQRVSDDSRPPDAPFWHLDAPPDDFTHRGRFVVSPPHAGGGIMLPGTEGPARIGVVDVWSAGPSLLVVENGGWVGGEAGEESSGGRVDVGALGEGRLAVDLRVVELHVELGGGRYVRVTGTMPPDGLVEIARSLEPLDGGTIVTVHG